MKDQLVGIVNEYIKVFPEEASRQQKLLDYINETQVENVLDWNNFNGHIVASGFIYARKEQQFLMIYHKDLHCFLYPGGHIDPKDENILISAIREVKEETGITDFKEFQVSKNNLVPIDIDMHLIDYNHRLDLPEHYHFDFRYLFIIDKIIEVQIDKEESLEYKWVGIEEFEKNNNCGQVLEKIKKIIITI